MPVSPSIASTIDIVQSPNPMDGMDGTPLYSAFDIPNILTLDPTLPIPNLNLWPGIFQNHQHWTDAWNGCVDESRPDDGPGAPQRRTPSTPKKKKTNKGKAKAVDPPKLRVADKAYRCTTGAYISRLDKGGIEKDDKRIHADLVDELSLPVLPVAPPAHLIAMNAPMASGRKDTPGIDAALAKYQGGWRLACDSCLGLYIPVPYTGPGQVFTQQAMIAANLNVNYATRIRLIEYGPFILCRGCIGVAKGKGMLPSCGPCRVTGEMCKEVDASTAIRLNDAGVHPIKRAIRAFTIIRDHGQMQKPDRIRIAQYGLDALKNEVCHGWDGDELEDGEIAHERVVCDGVMSAFD